MQPWESCWQPGTQSDSIPRGAFLRPDHTSLERALGRKVEIGPVRYSFFPTPGFSVDRVVIYDKPEIGMEPLAYANSGNGGLTARLSVWAALRGRLEFSSIKLEDASINLVKTSAGFRPGALEFRIAFEPQSPGWPFPPSISWGRMNFKFGDTKSVFYLTNVDLDVTPPRAPESEWRSALFRRTGPHRSPGARASGAWKQTERLERRSRPISIVQRRPATRLARLIALVSGQPPGIHGLVSSRHAFLRIRLDNLPHRRAI